MSVLKGDYIGFTYNGKHSSDLGIVRTSDGSRFNENLLPTMQDKTVQVPGGDGTYYFGSYFTQRQFTVSFAYDSLTEKQVADLKKLFGDKQIHDLIFDERPYKVYRAKVTGTATIKYIAFAEGDENRLYKGEGSVQFTCYEPFAICKKKWLSQYEEENLGEWKAASGLKQSQGSYDIYSANSIDLWNPGDIESHFELKLNFSNDMIAAGSICLNGDNSLCLSWKRFAAEEEDVCVKINSRLNLIEGYKNTNGTLVKSGNIYNQHFSGNFFKIPLGESNLQFTGTNSLDSNPIEYYYYYF